MNRNAKVLLFGAWAVAATYGILTVIGWFVVPEAWGWGWYELFAGGGLAVAIGGFGGLLAYLIIHSVGSGIVSYIEREQRPKIGGEG